MSIALGNVSRCGELHLSEEFRLRPPVSTSDTVIEMAGRAITVPGIDRDVKCKIATRESEWEQAFRLVAANYKARGYESDNAPEIRFTPYHALPETVTLIAQAEGHVLATLSLVFDNRILGLPMETIYAYELNELRRKGRRLVEVTGLADAGLSLRQFLPVFVTLMRLLAQYTIHRGSETWVITINPRHRAFYRKALGFVPFGQCRSYPTVQNAPAEAYWLDPHVLQSDAPEMYERILGQKVHFAALTSRLMPIGLIHHFASCVNQPERRLIEDVLAMVDGDEPVHRSVAG